MRTGRAEYEAWSIRRTQEQFWANVNITGLSGREGPAAISARKFAANLAARVTPVPVRLVDERFTTSTAHEALRASGHDSRDRRQTVDSAAAAVLLAAALESERRTGNAPGQLVDLGTAR